MYVHIHKHTKYTTEMSSSSNAAAAAAAMTTTASTASVAVVLMPITRNTDESKDITNNETVSTAAITHMDWME